LFQQEQRVGLASTRKTRHPLQRATAASFSPATALCDGIRSLILVARKSAAQTVNAQLVLLYWEIGKRIRREVMKDARAEYGERVIVSLSRRLERDFGRGFGARNLFRMVRFAEVFPNNRIVSALRTQLGWTHFRQIIALDDPLKRQFYAEMCRIERWSTRTLEKKIRSMLFERAALSRKPARLAAKELAALREEDRLTPDLVFRDPYILDFLGLKDAYAEKDLEAAILREIESFILELGVGFAFVERQKRLQIDDRDYYLDLLFYHRKLRRLVVIDLKIGDFEAGDKGQMELYLNWLKRYACEPGEDAPLGLILCAGKSQQHVELLELHRSGIHVASYWTEVLPREELERRLRDAVQVARSQMAAASLRNAPRRAGHPRCLAANGSLTSSDHMPSTASRRTGARLHPSPATTIRARARRSRRLAPGR
jgi:predicted nuclease of restriction endonuclease-like (RecB) superfamily